MRARKREPSETYSLFDRFAIAFACLLVSVPLALLFWFLTGRWAAGMGDDFALSPFLMVACGLALLAFAMPVWVTDALAWFMRLLYRIGQWW